MLYTTIKQLKQKYIYIISSNLDGMEDEIIRGSPVLTGYFKSQWKTHKDYSNFTFRMSNDVVYGLKLWRYHHSKKGWSPYTGDMVVSKHSQKLAEDIKKINNQKISI